MLEDTSMRIFVWVCFLEQEGQQENTEKQIDRGQERDREKKMNGRKMVSVLPLPLRNVQLLS